MFVYWFMGAAGLLVFLGNLLGWKWVMHMNYKANRLGWSEKGWYRTVNCIVGLLVFVYCASAVLFPKA